MDKDIFLFLSIDVFCSTCLEGKDYPLNPLNPWSIKTSEVVCVIFFEHGLNGLNGCHRNW